MGEGAAPRTDAGGAGRRFERVRRRAGERYGGRYYGGGPGYHGSPYRVRGTARGYGRYNDPYRYGSRGYGGYEGRRFSQPRFEGPSQQDRLRQHWIDQSRRAR
jgi:hypothetical protein